MKGIILAGGSGTRLHPLTLSISKQLLPVYDKPMIYYPLSTLMLAGIREILIISTPRDLPIFESLLGTGEQLGIQLSYAVQPAPEGIAQALLIAENFIGSDPVCLILGDNIFYGNDLQKKIQQAIHLVEQDQKAVVFGYTVKDPERYGVVEFDDSHQVLSIEEKPVKPKSNFAVVGLYFYPNTAVAYTKTLTPSQRGELEITSLNNLYLAHNNLVVQLLGRGFAWLDTGTHESLVEATEFVKTVEKRTGLKIGCLEEIALSKQWVSAATLEHSIASYKGEYYDYIRENLRIHQK
ncbi:MULTISPECIES: glucose-1-phosphate thymidylyltransferase RfbA [unclassified Myroides]|uniref:glucose-1-phosphate thymidylyltransferase RfbA n=1 Tax=unclassified Myroides TaxID=2642485 RepID=UPI0015FE7EEE|nr:MULTISPECIES: glucose-1-phosphate thymidylyltransferase RfbA [unclassified Myroides]MBB1150132.1 glucose-1-phosphate thymidylyltransferase RfbA [Myroides sp. NP-2]MDM1408365.1 glucose-1-phosphate thymidylyltransferase RfbA [Myroides sp. DF42-4-2]